MLRLKVSMFVCACLLEKYKGNVLKIPMVLGNTDWCKVICILNLNSTCRPINVFFIQLSIWPVQLSMKLIGGMFDFIVKCVLYVHESLLCVGVIPLFQCTFWSKHILYVYILKVVRCCSWATLWHLIIKDSGVVVNGCLFVCLFCCYGCLLVKGEIYGKRHGWKYSVGASVEWVAPRVGIPQGLPLHSLSGNKKVFSIQIMPSELLQNLSYN